MDATPHRETHSFTSLMRCFVLVAAALLAAFMLAPLAFQLAQKVPVLNEYPFSRVFNRVAEILVVASLALGWRWMGIRLQIKHLLRRKDLPNCLPWFALGFGCIFVLIVVQYSVGIRILRERTIWYLLAKLFSSLLTAVTVGLLEELFFRGFVLQALRQRLKVFWAIFITSFLFSFVHLFTLGHLRKAVEDVRVDADSLLAGFAYAGMLFAPLKDPVAVIPGLFGLFLTGWLLAELTVRFRSLWPAIGLHAGWVLGIQYLNRIWKFKPGADAAPLWLFGERFAATGVFGWVLLIILIVIVRRRLPLNTDG